jgi:hypothetical protein
MHTPGPWTWGEKFRGLYGSGPNNEVLSWYAYEGMHLIQGDTEANARLIAAAPELLDVAKKALAAWTGDGPAIVLDELRAAISKATGTA